MSNGIKETKLCKHCQTEIPKKAKVCPNCRKKQGGKLKWIIIAVAAIIIIASAAGGGGKNEPEKVGENNISTKSNNDSANITKSAGGENTVFKKGEMAELNGVQVTLTNYEESSGSAYNKPMDGNLFVLAEFEIANNSNSELTISSMMSFEAYADDYALNYSLSAMIDKDGNYLDGTIAAGKKMKGWIGWELPEDYQTIEIHFTDNVWSNDKFVFLIEK